MVTARARAGGGRIGETRRLFVAVEIPPGIKEELTRLQHGFRDLRGRITWVRPQGMHVTLKFLGATPARRIPALVRALEEAAGSCPAFDVRLAGAGVFPGPSRPRVLWVGVDLGAEALVALASAVERCLERIGVAPEGRPFRPHVTLGRIKELADPAELVRRAASLEGRTAGEMHVGEIHLMESRLDPGGAVYTSLARAALGRAGASPSSNP